MNLERDERAIGMGMDPKLLDSASKKTVSIAQFTADVIFAIWMVTRDE